MADPRAFAYLFMNPAQRSDRLIIRDLEIHMVPFRHDIALIRLQGPTDVDYTQWDTGVPLRIDYGRYPSSTASFYGYVLATSRNWEQTTRLAVADRTIEILAIGASYWMKSGLSATFSGLTSSQIAQRVAAAYYLDIDAPATPYVWPAKNAGGTTAWAFLCELAKASGLTCAVNGTQLRFYDRMTILRRGNVAVPTFYEKDSGQGLTVLEMTTDASEVQSEDGRRKRNRIVQGIDIRTGGAIYAADDGSKTLSPFLATRYRSPIFDEYVTDLVTTSQAAALNLLPARVIENRFHIRAKARLAGDTRVVQESPVVLEGLGPKDSGVWQAIEVTHRVHKNWYSLECELGRDSDYDNGIRPGLPAGVARPHNAPYETTVFNNPPTVLIHGHWRAAWNTQAVAS